MRVSGMERVDLPAAEVFARLSDPERLGEALPAVQSVDAEGPDRFTAAFRPTTGLGVTPMRMTFEVTERQEPQRLRVVGDGGAAEYAVRVDAAFELVDQGDTTEVHWSADARVAGVLRSLTQRVLPQIVSDQVADVLRAAKDEHAASGKGPGW